MPRKKSWVKAETEWVSVDDVEFIDIEEGPYGDEMTFEHNGKEFKSIIALGSQPG